jgi:hypothetical protein
MLLTTYIVNYYLELSKPLGAQFSLVSNYIARPQAVLDLCYRHIVVTLFPDPEGGPHWILLEFTYEFAKQLLGIKET